MITYVFMTNPDGEAVECAACKFDAPLHEFDIGILNDRRKALYCELCAGSHISSAHQYPNQQDVADVILAIGYVGNAILAKLGQFVGAKTIILPPESGDER